jgi:dTMP kinase
VSLFITFEGGEGSGKTSHLTTLTHEFSRRRIPYRLSLEPGGTRIGDAIREVLLNPEHTEMVKESELLLYLASRKQHLEEVIKPSLAEGRLVLCDRYEDSSVVYQGYARGIGMDKVRSLSRAAGIDLLPDLTIVFDVPPEIGLERARGRSLEGITRFENERLRFHHKVQEGFLLLAEQEPERIVVIDTTRPFREVEEELLAIILPRLEAMT